MQWVDKYFPSLDELVGHADLPARLRKWARSPKKPLLFTGPPGVGKTSAALALAKEMDWEVMEMNASRVRNKDAVRSILGAAAQQASLFSKGKLILIDEVDGTHERGGTGEIAKVLKTSKFPIILTANDAWDRAIRPLKPLCEEVAFKRPTSREIVSRLTQICEKEGIATERACLMHIASVRDVRSAISDLELVSCGRKTISAEHLDLLGGRDSTKNIFDSLVIIFKTMTVSTARQAAWSVDKTPDELLLWIEENIAREYAGSDVARAYDALSRADVFRGRIFRRQNWSLLSYVSDLATAGVALAKKEKYRKFSRYFPPRWLRLMGRSKATRAMKKRIARKFGPHLHVSSKYFSQYKPLLKSLFRKHPTEAAVMVEKWGLEPDEAAFIMDTTTKTKMVQKLFSA